MEVIHWMRSWFANLFRPKGMHDDLAEEMEHHLSMAIGKKVAEGLSPKEARREALKEFGAVERIKEECHDAWGTRLVMDLWRDLLLSLRLLKKNKGFALAVLLTLGLCISGNTIVFSILDEVLGPPSYPEPNRVVEIYHSMPGMGIERSNSSIGLYLDYSENTTAFEQLALVDDTGLNISTDDGATMRGLGLRVSQDFFEMIRVRPLIGQFFEAEHFVHSNNRHVILTESFWRTQFASDTDVIGQTIKLHSRPFKVIGVAPRQASIHFPELRFFQAWTWNPNTVDLLKSRRYQNYTQIWGRLKPGISVEQARAQISALDRRFYNEAPQTKKDRLDRSRPTAKLETFQESRVKSIGSRLYLLQASVLLVLLIGCINVLNLQLTRSLVRIGEYAMRRSLGASRISLLRQVFTENLILCMGSCAIGIVGAWIGLEAINQFVAQDLLPNVSRIEISSTTIAHTIFLTICVAIVLGFFSALPVLKDNQSALVQGASRKTTASKPLKLFRSILVSMQVAVSLILLVGAGLLLQSFFNALRTDTGFDPRSVKTFGLELSWDYGSEEAVTSFYDRLKESFSEIAGVEAIALTEFLPTVSEFYNWDVLLASPSDESSLGKVSSNYCGVSDGFFELLGIPLVEGRTFRPSDMLDGVRNVVVDRRFADHYFPGRNAVGQQITNDAARTPESMWTIVGVVEDITHNGLDRRDIASSARGWCPLVYLPLNSTNTLREFHVLIETDRSFEDLMPVARAHLRGLDPLLPIYMPGELENMIVGSVDGRRAFVFLLGILGFMALLLSAVGIYGVLSYDVSQYTREIGLRIAIGSPKNLVLGQVLNQGLAKAAFGSGLGLVGAWALSKYLTDYLYQVNPIDPIAYFFVTTFLLVVVLIASYLPARQATRICPMEALRVD